MKSIFTWPDNNGTSYIDPDYVGDTSEGFTKRVDDLRLGNYKAWNGQAPTSGTSPATTGQIMGAMSKYNNVPYLEDTGGNNTIYKFWQETLIGTFSDLHSYDIDKIKYVLKGGQLVVALQSDEPLGIYDGQVYNYTGDNWPNVGSATPGPISVERLGAIGSADQDWFYPLEYLTVTAGNFIIGEDYTITTVGTTNFVAIGSPNNIVGTQFTATGAGTGTGTATSVGDTYIQPDGQEESFAIFRADHQLFYAKGHSQGTWDLYKLPASWINLGSSNTWFQDDPSIITNFLVSDPTNGAIGDIATKTTAQGGPEDAYPIFAEEERGLVNQLEKFQEMGWDFTKDISTNIKNFLGFQGSYISDLFLQSFGLIAYLIPLSYIITGVNIFRRKEVLIFIENKHQLLETIQSQLHQ